MSDLPYLINFYGLDRSILLSRLRDAVQVVIETGRSVRVEWYRNLFADCLFILDDDPVHITVQLQKGINSSINFNELLAMVSLYPSIPHFDQTL